MALVAISEETHQALKLAKVIEGRDMQDIVEEVLQPRVKRYLAMLAASAGQAQLPAIPSN